MIVYKLLSKSPWGLRSFIVSGEHGLSYPIGERIEHPNMFVYVSEAAARADGYGLNPRLTLWECETTSARPVPSLILRSHMVNEHFDAYWNNLENWPQGLGDFLRRPVTVALLVDDLKLVREVPRL